METCNQGSYPPVIFLWRRCGLRSPSAKLPCFCWNLSFIGRFGKLLVVWGPQCPLFCWRTSLCVKFQVTPGFAPPLRGGGPSAGLIPSFSVASYLVDPSSSHMLVSKIKPCMSKYNPLEGETAKGSLNHT